MAYYHDLREYVAALEAHGKLFRIKREINKDTELMPLVRWQFRGLPERERRAFLFERITDARGKKYPMPLLVASYAASADVYAIGMMCETGDIMQKWAQAQLHPIAPVMVTHAPVQEVVHAGGSLLEHGGLLEFPIPLSTPGFDNAP
ncbi:MAG: UbiD family decarboxylase [Chloroflexi bacterium]|nr:UbiD family decarboxylase [Chloroflexota bacterium]